MIAIGRGDTPDTVHAYKSGNKYTFPMVADPEEVVVRKFASENILRMHFDSGDGIILFQSTGFYPEEVEQLRCTIRRELEARP